MFQIILTKLDNFFLTQTRIKSITSRTGRGKSTVNKRRCSGVIWSGDRVVLLLDRRPGVVIDFVLTGVTAAAAPRVIVGRFDHAPRVGVATGGWRYGSSWRRRWLNEGISKIDVGQLEKVVRRFRGVLATTGVLFPETRVSDWPEMNLRCRKEKHREGCPGARVPRTLFVAREGITCRRKLE